jgi:hypothetical protein
VIRVCILLALAGAALPGQTLSISGVLLDPSNAPVPSAQVLLRRDGSERSALTHVTGRFRFDALSLGNYDLVVAVSGFEPVQRRVTVGAQPLRPLSIRLKLATLKEQITVTEDSRQVSVAADRNADSISVERSMLDSLPILDNNYLSTLSRFLDPGSPGDAGPSLIVDGMEARNIGVTASAIQEIKINNNAYTVEYPRWSRRRVEVITKTAADRYHGTLNFLFRDYHLNARDPLAATRPQEQRRIWEGSLFGPIANSKRTSFLLSGARENEDLVSVVFAQGLHGPINQNVPAPQVNTVGSLRISHQLNDNQAMFWQVNFQDRWINNVGVGGTTLAEAGAQSRFREDEFIFNYRLTITPKLLSQFRILVGRYWSPLKSNVDDAKVVVSDAFTGGGAQADRLTTEFHTSITWLMTQTAGRHTLKYGINIPDWSRRGLRDETNRIATLSFGSLADYSALRPFSAVLQRGDPRTIFVEKNVGGFFQDEWQIRSNVSVAAGLRYDWQNYLGDGNNVAPRLAIAYGPGKARKWVIRAGAGFFFDRSGPQPIWDILRFNGQQLRRYVLTTAQIPQDLGSFTGPGFPSSIHQLQPGVQLPDIMQFSASLERQLTKKSLLSMTYTGTRGVRQFRSRDANAPLPPLFDSRPNSTVNVLREIESAGRLEGNALEISMRGDLAPRVTGMVQYVFSKTMSDTAGVNWYPAASYAPQGEWGRADTDRRHQFNFLGTAAWHRWLNFGISASILSGLPYNITTGRDNNRDGIAVDRPVGVTRNTGLGPENVVLDLRWYREFRFEPSKKDKSPSLTFSVDAFNIFNHVNYQNYVGSLTSPFFGRAVSALPPRRLQLGVRFQF